MAASGLSQRQKQSQIQAMGQSQIQSLEILSMGGDDLREAVYKEVQDNPALVITRDAGGGNVRLSHALPDATRVSSSAAAGEQESDRHQAALEARADTRLSLQDQLLSQLHVQRLSEEEMRLGERLIGNLDSRGFHILAPVSLLDKDSTEGESMLQKLIPLIQSLDPAGCCCKDTEESLLVQARQRPSPPRLALFLLDGHLDFLNPPVVSSIVRKSQAFFEARSKLFGVKENPDWKDMRIDANAAENALTFIRTLDPFPARDYSTAETRYIAPDVYVERIPGDDAEEVQEDFSRGIIVQDGSAWRVRLTSSIPAVGINPSYKNYSGTDSTAVIRTGIRRAKEFISALEERQDTLLRGSCMIVKRQHAFFESGPGNLVTFRQKDVASVLGLHEATISRMAGSKYLQCSWGLFPLKYFFLSPAGPEKEEGEPAASRDQIKAEIRKIIKEQEADGGKKISDQKISDILAGRGIKVARRTVAKYRADM